MPLETGDDAQRFAANRLGDEAVERQPDEHHTEPPQAATRHSSESKGGHTARPRKRPVQGHRNSGNDTNREGRTVFKEPEATPAADKSAFAFDLNDARLEAYVEALAAMVVADMTQHPETE